MIDIFIIYVMYIGGDKKKQNIDSEVDEDCRLWTMFKILTITRPWTLFTNEECAVMIDFSDG